MGTRDPKVIQERQRELSARLWRSERLPDGFDASGLLITDTERDVDLSGVNLTGAVIEVEPTGMNLTGADLTGATLIKMFMDGCDLTGACLRDATFHDSMLHRTRFDRVDATGAWFTGRTDLDGTLVRQTDLTDTRFSELILQDATIATSDLTGMRVGRLRVIGSDIRWVNGMDGDTARVTNHARNGYTYTGDQRFTPPEFIDEVTRQGWDTRRGGSRLEHPSGATLTTRLAVGLGFRVWTPTGVRITDSDLRHTAITLGGNGTTAADITNTDMSGARLTLTDCVGKDTTRITDSVLHRAMIRLGHDYTPTHITITDTDARGLVMVGSGSNHSGATVTFIGCDLTGAVFSNVESGSLQFTDCDLTGAMFIDVTAPVGVTRTDTRLVTQTIPVLPEAITA